MMCVSVLVSDMVSPSRSSLAKGLSLGKPTPKGVLVLWVKKYDSGVVSVAMEGSGEVGSGSGSGPLARATDCGLPSR